MNDADVHDCQCTSAEVPFNHHTVESAANSEGSAMKLEKTANPVRATDGTLRSWHPRGIGAGNKSNLTKWITLALTTIMLAACGISNPRPDPNCKVAVPISGTGPQGCFNAEDLRSLCRAAMECGGGVDMNNVSFSSCTGGPNADEVLGELMNDGPWESVQEAAALEQRFEVAPMSPLPCRAAASRSPLWPFAVPAIYILMCRPCLYCGANRWRGRCSGNEWS